jgi:chemotaxis regulatin CheY-phosphate phosphatase CheZ
MLSIAAPAGLGAAIPADWAELTGPLHAEQRKLGYDLDIASAERDLPDAWASLDCVSQLMGNSASRVLALAERAWEVQKRMDEETTCIVEGIQSWDDLEELRHVLESHAESVIETNADLLDIVLAQGCHDLSGQTMQRIDVVAAKAQAESPLDILAL